MRFKSRPWGIVEWKKHSGMSRQERVSALVGNAFRTDARILTSITLRKLVSGIG
jgi:hypothetical protein